MLPADDREFELLPLDSPSGEGFAAVDDLVIEAQALVQVGAALALLPPEGQTRVVRWAISRYAVKHLRDLLGGTS